VHMAEAILALSGTTNGEVAVTGWRALEERTGVKLADQRRFKLATDAQFRQRLSVGPRRGCVSTPARKRTTRRYSIYLGRKLLSILIRVTRMCKGRPHAAPVGILRRLFRINDGL